MTPRPLPTFPTCESVAHAPGSLHTERLRRFLAAADALTRAVLAVDTALGSAAWRPVPSEPHPITSAEIARWRAAHTAANLDGFDAAILGSATALRPAVLALGQVADLVAAVHTTAPAATVAVGVLLEEPASVARARREVVACLVFAGFVDTSAHDCFHAGRARLLRADALARATS